MVPEPKRHLIGNTGFFLHPRIEAQIRSLLPNGRRDIAMRYKLDTAVASSADSVIPHSQRPEMHTASAKAYAQSAIEELREMMLHGGPDEEMAKFLASHAELINFADERVARKYLTHLHKMGIIVRGEEWGR